MPGSYEVKMQVLPGSNFLKEKDRLMKIRQNKGLTLIELMTSIAIFSFVLTASMAIFHAQQNSFNAQQAVVEAQQGGRAAMYFMSRELRLAGYDEPETRPAGAGFITAGPSVVQFSASIHNGFDDDGDLLVDEWDEAGNIAFNGRDDDGDGVVDGFEEAQTLGVVDQDVNDPNEVIRYGFDPTDDADGDGIADNPPGMAPLTRNDINGANTFERLGENIEAIGFAYAFDDDFNGQIDFLDMDGDGVQGGGEPTYWAIDTDADGWLDTLLDTNDDGAIDINDGVAGKALNPPVEITRIRAVQLWLLARAGEGARDYVNTRTYVVGNKRVGPVNDNFRRRLLNTVIVCRNMDGVGQEE